MNLRKEFNRVGHLFQDGVEKTQKAGEDWAQKQAKQAGAMARRLRGKVDVRPLVSAEERLVRHMRDNSGLYMLGLALLLGLVIVKLLAGGRDEREAPLL